MSKTASRPNLARKVTRTSKQKQDAELNAGLRVVLSEGEAYEIRMGDVTPAAARELRRQCGFGFHSLLQQLGADPDVDLISTFVWLARRLAGEEDLDLNDVVVGYDVLVRDEFDCAPVTEGEVIKPGPEA